jgi:AcrR family transcriptional regulator
MILDLNGDSKPQGRKERELQLRRQEILDAARKVFAEEGYFKATMSRIAARAEFGMGTLYQFFPSKQDLFISVILEEAESFVQGLKNTLSSAPSLREQLKAYIEYKLSWVEDHPDIQRLIMEMFYMPIPNVTPHIIDRLKEIHTQDILMIKNIFAQANRPNPDLLALIVIGTTDAIANDLSMGTKILKKTPTKYVSEIINSILGGG